MSSLSSNHLEFIADILNQLNLIVQLSLHLIYKSGKLVLNIYENYYSKYLLMHCSFNHVELLSLLSSVEVL